MTRALNILHLACGDLIDFDVKLSFEKRRGLKDGFVRLEVIGNRYQGRTTISEGTMPPIEYRIEYRVIEQGKGR